MISFLRYLLRGYKWYLTAIILVGFANIAAGLFFIWLSKRIVDVATGEREGVWYIYAIALVATFGLQVALRLVRLWVNNRSEVKMGNTIRLKIFSQLLYTRWQNLIELHSGDMITRIIIDTDAVVTLLVSTIPSAIVASVQLLAALVFLYILSPTLAITVGIGTPLLTIFSKLYYRYMISYSNKIKETQSDVSKHIQEVLMNQNVVRSFDRQEEEIDKLRLIQNDLYSTVNKRTNVSIYSNLFVNMAFGGGSLWAFIWCVVSLMNKTITYGTMTSFLQLVNRIQQPLLDLLGYLPSVIASKASLHRLIKVLDMQTEAMGKGISLQKNLSLDIEALSFRYEEDEPWVLQDFSMSVKSGQMVAVMGDSGSGKTTLIRLLLGFISPNQGNLTLSSDKKSIQLNENTRSNFVYVPQGNSLFSGTIRENLLIGDSSATDDKLRQVLLIASADFVFDLPQQLDTQLGEKGAGLSEGQAQRIAIARALLRPGKILLLDEATSALDQDTERIFVSNLRKYIGERIILFITHHPEVARDCDHIITL